MCERRNLYAPLPKWCSFDAVYKIIFLIDNNIFLQEWFNWQSLYAPLPKRCAIDAVIIPLQNSRCVKDEICMLLCLNDVLLTQSIGFYLISIKVFPARMVQLKYVKDEICILLCLNICAFDAVYRILFFINGSIFLQEWFNWHSLYAPLPKRCAIDEVCIPLQNIRCVKDKICMLLCQNDVLLTQSIGLYFFYQWKYFLVRMVQLI